MNRDEKANSPLARWPILRQLTGEDRWGLGEAAVSQKTKAVRPRTERAEKLVQSVCPYCAVGCGQLVFVEDGKITQIEGDPDSPISRGRLCPKGSATKELVTRPGRQTKVKYRAPFAAEWQEISLDRAMDLIVERVIKTRSESWEDIDDQGCKLHRTMGIASLGGATLDNEENYLMKKLYTALGAVQIENQARI